MRIHRKTALAWLAPALLLALAACASSEVLVVSGQTRDTDIAAAFGEPTHVSESGDGLTEWVYRLPDRGGEFTESKAPGGGAANALHIRTFTQALNLTVLRFVFEDGVVVRANANSRGL